MNEIKIRKCPQCEEVLIPFPLPHEFRQSSHPPEPEVFAELLSCAGCEIVFVALAALIKTVDGVSYNDLVEVIGFDPLKEIRSEGFSQKWFEATYKSKTTLPDEVWLTIADLESKYGRS